PRRAGVATTKTPPHPDGLGARRAGRAAERANVGPRGSEPVELQCRGAVGSHRIVLSGVEWLLGRSRKRKRPKGLSPPRPWFHDAAATVPNQDVGATRPQPREAPRGRRTATTPCC